MRRMIFIFLDGVGMGQRHHTNPFFQAKSPYLPLYGENPHLPDGTPIKAIDPLLGIGGLPKSASGQTSLFTGENIPTLIGKHIGSYPNQLMRARIKHSNLLTLLKVKQLKAKFINAYPVFARFFTSEHIHIKEDGQIEFSPHFPDPFKRRLSTTTCMMVVNNDKPFDENDITNEQTIYQDFSNQILINKGLKLPFFTPEKAGEILYQLSTQFDFILYEYFQTDVYAHRRSLAENIELIEGLNRLIQALLSFLDKNTDTLLITSDHGNSEDFTTIAHTLNPVPLIVWGNQAPKIRKKINCIADVTPAICQFFSQPD